MAKETTQVYRTLPCKLTTQEVAKLADEQAAKELEKENLEAAKKASNATYAGKINILKEQLTKLATSVDSKIEQREILCERVVDDDRCEVRVMRKDTKEIVEERPFSADERAELDLRKQGTLFDNIPGAGKAKGKKSTKVSAESVASESPPSDVAPDETPETVEHGGQRLSKTRANKRGKKK